MKSKQTEITGFTKPENGTALHALPKEKKHPRSCVGPWAARGVLCMQLCPVLWDLLGRALQLSGGESGEERGWWGPWAGRQSLVSWSGRAAFEVSLF